MAYEKHDKECVLKWFSKFKKKKKKSRCESTFWEFDSITVPRNLCLGIVIVEVAVVIYGDPRQIDLFFLGGRKQVSTVL